jgi:hypothetical protein
MVGLASWRRYSGMVRSRSIDSDAMAALEG